MSRWLRFIPMMLLILFSAIPALAQGDIEVGDTVDGEESSEPVEYDIELEEGQVIEIAIEADWDTYLELYDEQGNQVAYDDDGGDGLQSLLIYAVPESGEYSILVRSFGSDTPAGDYELSVEEIEVVDLVDGGELEYGDDEEVDADDALAVEVRFEGEEGDVIDIFTTSDNYLDTTMTLLDPQGNEVAVSDNYYGDAVLRRVELEDDGTYTIRVEGTNGGVLDGDIEFEIELTEVITLDDGEVTVEIGDNGDMTFINFTAEDDVVYTLTLELDDEPDYSDVSIYILEPGQNLTDYAEYTMRMSGGTGMAYTFEAEDDGEFTIRIEYYGDDDIEVNISIEEAD